MITTEFGLQASQKALLHLSNALADLESEKDKYHPATFAILAEPILEQMQKTQTEIDEYEQRRSSLPYSQSKSGETTIAGGSDVAVAAKRS